MLRFFFHSPLARGTLLAAAAILLLAGLPARLQAFTAAYLLQQVDERLYFPQVHGLRDLSCQVRVVQILDQIKADPRTAALAPKVFYNYTAPDQDRVEILGFPAQWESLERQLWQIVMSKAEVFVARPWTQVLARYDCKAYRYQGYWQVYAAARDPKAAIQLYVLWLDPKFVPRQVEFYTGTDLVTSRIEYTSAGGGLVPSVIRSRIQASAVKGLETTVQISYRTVKDLVLPARIEVAGPEGRMTFLLDPPLLNQQGPRIDPAPRP